MFIVELVIWFDMLKTSVQSGCGFFGCCCT